MRDVVDPGQEIVDTPGVRFQRRRHVGCPTGRLDALERGGLLLRLPGGQIFEGLGIGSLGRSLHRCRAAVARGFGQRAWRAGRRRAGGVDGRDRFFRRGVEPRGEAARRGALDARRAAHRVGELPDLLRRRAKRSPGRALGKRAKRAADQRTENGRQRAVLLGNIVLGHFGGCASRCAGQGVARHGSAGFGIAEHGFGQPCRLFADNAERLEFGQQQFRGGRIEGSFRARAHNLFDRRHGFDLGRINNADLLALFRQPAAAADGIVRDCRNVERLRALLRRRDDRTDSRNVDGGARDRVVRLRQRVDDRAPDVDRRTGDAISHVLGRRSDIRAEPRPFRFGNHRLATHDLVSKRAGVVRRTGRVSVLERVVKLLERGHLLRLGPVLVDEAVHRVDFRRRHGVLERWRQRHLRLFGAGDALVLLVE